MTMMDLQATLEAGPAGEFFARVMQTPDEAPPQMVNAAEVIKNATNSGDPALAKWAETMQLALNHTAEAEALEAAMTSQNANDPLGLQGLMNGFMERLGQAMAAFKAGNIMDGIMALFNEQADPREAQLAAHRNDTQQALKDGDAYLKQADSQVAQNVLGADGAERISEAIDRIDRIAPSPVKGPAVT